MAFHRLQENANEAAEAVSQLGTQYQTLESLLKSSASAPAATRTAIEDIGKQLADLRRRLGVAAPGARAGGGGAGGEEEGGGGGGGGGGFGGGPPNIRSALGGVKGQLLGSHTLPSEQQMRGLTEGREDLTKAIADTNALIAKLPALYDQIGAGGLKPAALKPVRTVPSM